MPKQVHEHQPTIAGMRAVIIEWAGVALCIAAFLVLRLPLYTRPGVILGWHSDAALLGLMARAIAAGDVPLLFWGCDYLAPLTSLFAVIAGAFSPGITPLDLRLGVALEVFGAFVFFYLALRRIIGRPAALLSTFWLCAGPAFLFKLTYAPLSAEQYLFVGAVIFWYVCRAPFTTYRQWLILGLLTGIGWWIHRGAIFVVVPAVVAICLYEGRSYRKAHALAALSVLIAGAALGYVPAVIGKLTVDQRLYTPVTPPWTLAHLQQRVAETFRYDLWTFLGADPSALGIALGIAMVCLIAAAVRHFEPSRETVIATGVLATCAAFWLFSTHSYRGALRYVIVALPIAYAFAAAEIGRLWRGGRTPRRLLAAIVAGLVAAGLFIPRSIDVRATAAAQREQFEQWPGGFDPRPTLAILAREQYTVCYADVWLAHKLEWLSESGVRFIPYRSVNRRMVESLRLAALPGRKCFVDLDGRVFTLTKRQETLLRVETLWHSHGWRRSLPPLDLGAPQAQP